MKILTASQMAEVDRLSTEVFRLPSLMLMENAGRCVAEETLKELPGIFGASVYIFCGRGNNGGDGLVAARHLACMGARPEILLVAQPDQFRGDALSNWEIVHSMGLPATVLAAGAARHRQMRNLSTPAAVIDAILGTGLSKPIGPDLRPVVSWINSAGSRSAVISVDIPSGLFADSASLPGPVVRARRTVTFTALKLALVLPPAACHAGRVTVAPIGSPPALLDNADYRTELFDHGMARRMLPTRTKESHKGTYGHVFVVAGSRGKSGAALMTGQAALRAGAGLVTLLIPAGLQRPLVGKVPELMTESLPETPEGTLDFSALDPTLRCAEQADALVIGPGLTTHDATRRLVRELVRLSPVPIVLDADGINAFAGKPENLRNQAGRAMVLTPHPGEMARLLGITISQVQGHRLETALGCSRDHGWCTVLKGYRSIVATPDGRALINGTGNPGMATGGTGDVLAGMMGRFIAAWNRRFHGADLLALGDCIGTAVHLHGLAGDLAASDKGEESLVASDLIACLPQAFLSIRRGESGELHQGDFTPL